MANDDVGKILLIITVVALALIFIREVLVPLFAVISIALFIVLVVCLFTQSEFTGYVALALLVCFAGFGVSYGIGYGIGGSPVGQAVLETHAALTAAEQELFNALDSSVQSVVDESCKTLDQSSCNSIKFAAVSGKSLIEIQTMIDNFRTASKVVKRVDEKLG